MSSSLPELDDVSPAIELAERIAQDLSQPLFHDNKDHLYPVVGIADYPHYGMSAVELIRYADTAMDWCRRIMNAKFVFQS